MFPARAAAEGVLVFLARDATERVLCYAKAWADQSPTARRDFTGL